MRKLVLSMGMSLDGLVARPGRYGAGGRGLPPEDAALTQRKLGWMDDIGLHLSRLGLVDAKTYPTGAARHVYRPAAEAA